MDTTLLAELQATLPDQLRITLSKTIIGIGEKELSDGTVCNLKCMLKGRKQGFCSKTETRTGIAEQRELNGTSNAAV